MIVVDTNVIVAMSVPNDNRAIAREVWLLDPDWRAPALWRNEYRNVLVQRLRHGIGDIDAARLAMHTARDLIPGNHTYESEDDDVLSLASRCGCTAYDCEFVSLALRLDTKLLTWDQQLLREFPLIAIHPSKFTGQN
ncbi:MAG: type II toxin-antitoxin system VapC family toxin [Candidatus Hydrogenedentota bacterium]